MAFKLIYWFLVVAVVAQVSCKNIQSRDIIQETLADREVNHITNPHFGFGISIPHLILDTLEACTVEFPNGLVYEVYPNSNLPDTVSAGNSVFPACNVFFHNPPVSMSGTYILNGLTSHWDGKRTLRTQRFILNIRESEM